MFCHNCGKKLPDGSRFCSACGEKQLLEGPAVPAAAAAPAEPAAPEKPAAPVAPVVPVRPAASGVSAVPVQPAMPAASSVPTGDGKPAAAAPVAPAEPAKPGAVPRRKKFGGKVIIGIAAAVLVVAAAAAAAVAGFGAFFSGFGNDNAYAYLSDGTYELITNLDKGQSIEIASSRAELSSVDAWTLYNLTAFSPDGKYFYYFTKVTKIDDSLLCTGSLCRAEYGKLKQNGKNNDQYIEVVATNVLSGYQDGVAAIGFQFMEDGSVIYMNNDRTLYCYNGKEAVRIAKDVNVYDTDGGKRIVYITGDDSDGYTLYGVTLDDTDQKEKLASDLKNYGFTKYAAYCYAVNFEDFDNILYGKEEDDGSATLYVTGFGKDTEKIAENVEEIYGFSALSGWNLTNGKTYFLAKSGTALRLYDFVEDPYVSADAGLSEPVEEDFLIPRYSYEMVTGSNLSENDYGELYTTCTHRLYWYGENLSTCCSMEEALNRSWNDAASTEEVHSITRDFIDRFGDMADENGFIPVTDEVKAALKGIQAHDEQPEREWQWLWLCYRRYQSGTDIDYDAYNAAREEWNEAAGRIILREALQDPENDQSVYTLYCFEDGKLTALQENVLNAKEYPGAIVFNTPELVTETVPIDEIDWTFDVHKLFNPDSEAENYVLLLDGNQICRMSASAAKTYAEARENGRATLCFTGQEAYLSEENGTLSVAAISGGTVNDFSIVTDNAEVLDVDGSTLYYLGDSYESGEKTYGDLYSCTNGDSTRLAKDVMRGGGIRLYDDGIILASTGYNSSGYELSMIDSDGETTVIEDHITGSIRVNESLLLYLSDGDLYSYNGKEKNLVQTDVVLFWSRNTMKPLKSSFRYAYGSVHDDYSW